MRNRGVPPRAPARRRRVGKRTHSEILVVPPPPLATLPANAGAPVTIPSYAGNVHQRGGHVRAMANDPQATVASGGDGEGDGEEVESDLGQEIEDDEDAFFVPDSQFEFGNGSPSAMALQNGGQHEDSSRESVLTPPTRYLRSKDVFGMLAQGKTLSAIFAVVGTRRFAVWQYNFMRRRVNAEADSSRGRLYPSYSTLQKTLFPLLRTHAYVPSITVSMDVNSARSGASRPSIEYSGQRMTYQQDIRIVLISSWGKQDVSAMNYNVAASHIGSLGALHDTCACKDVDDVTLAQQNRDLLSSALLFTTELADGVEVPIWHFDSSTEVKIELRPSSGQQMGVLDGLAREVVTKGPRGRAMNRSWVIDTAKTGRRWVVTDESDDFYAADVVIELAPKCVDLDHGGRSGPCAKMLLVHRMVKTPGVSAFHLLAKPDGNISQGFERVRCVKVSPSSQKVTDLHPSPQYRIGPTCRVQRRLVGVLEDGRRYIVYRAIIFGDDFKPFVGKKGSAGGCYLLPIGIPLEERTGVKGIRVLSMTPPGISTGKMVKALIPDIIEGAVKGFPVKCRDGTTLHLFIDVVGYESDYFAVQEGGDVRGHRANNPCNLCTFEKCIEDGRQNSAYAYTTSIHSANALYRRDRAHMNAIRRVYTEEKDLQSVGLRRISEAERGRLPLHALSNALREVADQVPKTTSGVPVVSTAFDPYLSLLVAPDHLFTNLIEDVINANIKSMQKKERRCVDALMREGLQRSGIKPESRYIDHDKAQLHSMSFSSLYAVLLVVPWAVAVARSMNENGDLRLALHGTMDDAVHLAFMLKDLVADTLLYAREDRDGGAVAKQFVGSGWKQRERDLTRKTMNYVKQLDKCCGGSEVQAGELDKPNVHRLIELFVHTIPTYGHVRLYQELALERTHQPLKRALKKSNYNSAQLQAMDHVLADDWKARLKAAAGGSRRPEHLSVACLRSLQEVLTGERPDGRDCAIWEEKLRRMFDAATLADINEYNSMQTERVQCGDNHMKWTSSGEHILFTLGPSWDEAVKAAKATLAQQCRHEHSASDTCRINATSRVCLVHHAEEARRPHREAFTENISVGDVVQAVVAVASPSGNATAPGTTIMLHAPILSNTSETKPSFWYVRALLASHSPITIAGRSCEVFAIVSPLTIKQGGTPAQHSTQAHQLPPIYHLQSDQPSNACILPLYPAVMKVMRLHVCSGTCHFHTDSENLVHDGWEQGGSTNGWIIYGSIQGFPPRSG